MNAQTVLGSDCRYLRNDQWGFSYPQGGCSPSSGWTTSFLLSGSNEDYQFLNHEWFLPNDAILDGTPHQSRKRPYFYYTFHPKQGTTHQVGLVIDKINFASSYLSEVARYTGVFLNDVTNFSDATLDKYLFMDLIVSINASETQYDSQAGAAKNRTTVGFVAEWENAGSMTSNYLEVNLFRTPNFDLCTQSGNYGGVLPTTNCDPNGLYDRRNFHGGGEVVYYNLATVDAVAGGPNSSIPVDGNLRTITLPVGELFRDYAWARPPSNWSNVRIFGTYFGHEVWGKGRMWAELKQYDLYAFVAE